MGGVNGEIQVKDETRKEWRLKWKYLYTIKWGNALEKYEDEDSDTTVWNKVSDLKLLSGVR